MITTCSYISANNGHEGKIYNKSITKYLLKRMSGDTAFRACAREQTVTRTYRNKRRLVNNAETWKPLHILPLVDFDWLLADEFKARCVVALKKGLCQKWRMEE